MRPHQNGGTAQRAFVTSTIHIKKGAVASNGFEHNRALHFFFFKKNPLIWAGVVLGVRILLRHGPGQLKGVADSPLLPYFQGRKLLPRSFPSLFSFWEKEGRCCEQRRKCQIMDSASCHIFFLLKKEKKWEVRMCGTIRREFFFFLRGSKPPQEIDSTSLYVYLCLPRICS